MSELPVPVQVDPATGVWSVDGEPVVLVPRHFLVFIQMETEKRFGVEEAKAVLYETTTKAARLWCEREARTHGLSGADVFRHYMKRISQRGLGRITIEAIDPAAGRAEVRIENSVYVAEYGRSVGRNVCYTFASSMVGGMEYIAHAAGDPRKFRAEEVQCAANGADHCQFVVSPA